MSLALVVILFGLTARYGLDGLLRLSTLRLRGLWAVAVALLLQLALVAWPSYALPLTCGTMLAIGVVVILNRQLPGIVLIGAGALLNLVVMALHGGLMPVSVTTLGQMGVVVPEVGSIVSGTKGVVAAANSGWLGLASDALLLPGPLGSYAAWSVGDILLLAGIGVLCWSAMRGERYARFC